MSRSKFSIFAMIAAFVLCGHARAQGSSAPLEQYLTDRGLDDLLAEHLVEALATQSGDERADTARRLGQLYVRLLDRSQSEDDRRYWSERASNLLRLVPEADSTELRINLSKTAYMRAEAIAERTRLRMASKEETAQAERVLRDTASTFLEIAQASHLEAQRLEKRLSERLDEDAEQRVTQSLAAARQSRSLGFYYALATAKRRLSINSSPVCCATSTLRGPRSARLFRVLSRADPLKPSPGSMRSSGARISQRTSVLSSLNAECMCSPRPGCGPISSLS
jgi:hypothetical protein